MKAKQRIDIEDLLVWAYRDQCVDRQAAVTFSPRGPSASVANALGQYLTLGTRIDNCSQAARVLGVRLPEDSLAVHDCVLALADRWIVWRADDEIEIADIGGLAARNTQVVTAVLMIQHARTATRPDCHLDWTPPRGAPAKDGKPVDRWGRKRKNHAAVTGTSLDEVMLQRATYAIWHAALCDLVEQLRDIGLTALDVMPPAADAQPWNAKHTRILRADNAAIMMQT